MYEHPPPTIRFQKSGGTPAFYAPEMCTKGDYRGRPADMWACGVTLCMLVGGSLPFEADNLPALFDRSTSIDGHLA